MNCRKQRQIQLFYSKRFEQFGGLLCPKIKILNFGKKKNTLKIILVLIRFIFENILKYLGLKKDFNFYHKNLKMY